MVRVWGGCAFQGKVEGAKERRIKLFMLFVCVRGGGGEEGVCHSPTKKKKRWGEGGSKIRYNYKLLCAKKKDVF